MLQIKKIIAENLFSWKRLEIDFDSNTSYSFIGENGSGKSSLFEIITWVLFKKSTKHNIKGNYGEIDGYGKIFFDNEFIVMRETKEPLTIQFNGNTVEQGELDKVLGCNYETFMASIMCNQKRISSFVNEKTDTGKAKIFAEMLGIGMIDDIRGRISKLKTERELKYTEVIAKEQAIKEQFDTVKLKMENIPPAKYKEKVIDKLKSRYAVLKQEFDVLKKEYDENLELMKEWAAYEQQQENIKRLKEMNRNKMVKIKEMKDKLIAIGNKEELEARWKRFSDAKNNRDIELNQVKNNINALVKERSDLDKVIKVGGVCPTCGGDISAKVKVLRMRRKEISNKIELVEKDKITIADKLDKILPVWRKLSDQLIEYKDIEKDIKISEANLIDIDSGIKFDKPDKCKPESSEMNKGVNEKSEELFNCRRMFEDGLQLLKDYIKYRDLYTNNKGTSAAAEKAFYIAKWLFENLPMIKLLYIDDNKAELENLINTYINEMNIPFMVSISTKKELKSKKEIKDEFSFKIECRDKNVHKDDLSGGEETLILLATQMAINDLIQPSIGIEIYDEIFGMLSDKHIDTVINMIKERSDKKQIFVVSHKPEISQSFESTVFVTNKDGESYVSF